MVTQVEQNSLDPGFLRVKTGELDMRQALSALVEMVQTTDGWLILSGAALATGGFAKAPDHHNTWDAQCYALDIYGITAWDTDRDRCIDIWRSAAQRHLKGAGRLEASLNALFGGGNHSVGGMLAHCETVLELSDDHEAREVARQVHAAVSLADKRSAATA